MQAVAHKHVSFLRQSGHTVKVLHSRVDHGSYLSEELDYHRVKWPSSIWGLKKFPGHYAFKLHRMSLEVFEHALDFRPDVIYAEGPVVSYLLDKKLGIPIIFHPHGLEVLQLSYGFIDTLRFFWLKKLVKKHCRMADAVCSQGGELLDIIVEKGGGNPSNVHLIANSFDVQGEAKSKVAKGKRFLFVGRIEARKRLSLLLDFFTKNPNLSLDVVGSDQLGPSVPNIVFHGIVRNKDKLRNMYKEAHFLLLPSTAEGMPTVILEALSVGTPVVSTNVGACSELVIDGETGWCVNSLDADQFCNAIIQAHSVTDLDYGRFSRNGIDRLKSFNSAEIVKDQLLSIFNHCRDKS